MSSLNPCQIPDIVHQPNKDLKTGFCPPNSSKNFNNVPFLDDNQTINNNTGLGRGAACSDGQDSRLVPDLEDPQRGRIVRYSKSLRGTDEAVKDLFSDIQVIAVNGEVHTVPVIWGTQEKAISAIIQSNVRQDNSLTVDRIRLPMLAIYASAYTYDEARYTYEEVRRYFPDESGKPQSTISEQFQKDTILSFSRGVPVNIEYQLISWTSYIEDTMQIMEQVFLKVPKMTYIKVQGVTWEVPVRLTNISNNLDLDIGDQALRIIKYQFSLIAETYVPQPIIRRKAALKTVMDVVNAETPDNIQEVLSTHIQSVKELETC